MGGQRLALLPPLLAGVELVEAVANDGYGKADDKDAKDGAETANKLANGCHWGHVSIANLKNIRFNFLKFLDPSC